MNTDTTAATTPPALTRRELQVIQLIAAGLTGRAIAARLDTTWAAVRTSACRAYRKLGAPNRIAASVTAVRLGLVAAPGADTIGGY